MRPRITGAVIGAWMFTATAAAFACESDSDCKGSRICAEGVCVDPPSGACQMDTDCAGDEVCDQSRCTLPQEPAESPAPEPPPAAVAPSEPPPFVQGDVSPSEDRTTESIKGLWIAGLVTLGFSWIGSIPAAAAISAASGSSDPGAHAGIMAIPLVGPWVEAGGVLEEATTVAAPAFVALGVLQIGGALMTILGFSLQREVSHVAVVPMGPDSWGLQLNGSLGTGLLPTW